MNRRGWFGALVALIGIRPRTTRKVELANGSWVIWEEIRNEEGRLVDGRIVSSGNRMDAQQ